jgi:hypothetical protein
MPNIDNKSPNDKPDAKLVGLWEAYLKAVNSLMIAHGAGLVTCLTLLKDYDANPKLKGIGFIITMFACGLAFAILAYSALMLHRHQTTLSSKPWFKGYHWAFANLAALISATNLMIVLAIASLKFLNL